MKKIYFFLLASLWLFAACDDDDDGPVTLSLGNPTYTLKADAPLEITLNASENMRGLTAIDFRLSGTAIENEDYIISDHQFVFLPATRAARIQITPKENYVKDRSIQLSLIPANGFEMTENTSATISVEARQSVIYSFTRENTDLYDSRLIRIKVTDSEGNPWSSATDLHLPFTLAGTAAAGTHYAVKDNAGEFIVPAGQDEGSIILDYIALEEGCDNIQIAVTENSGVHAGNYGSISVQIVAPNILSDMRGDWIYNNEFLSMDYFSWWVSYPEDMVNLPDNNTSSGSIRILSEEADSLIVNLTGDLANYFRNCSLNYLNETEETLMEQDMIDGKITWVMATKANVNFSPSHTTEKKAMIGFRFPDESKDLLEVRIVDYLPTDFLVLSYEDMLSSLDEEWLNYPMKDFYPLVFTFKRQ